MKWFDKWFAKKCKQAWENSKNEGAESDIKINVGGLSTGRPQLKRDEGLRSQSTNFSLYNANGGTVVELRSYNENTDRNHNVLYIIPSDKDLGQELGHIVTMEALKR
jgi:hypothetical protein